MDKDSRPQLIRRLVLPGLSDKFGEQSVRPCEAFVGVCNDTIRRVGAIYRLRAADLDDFVQDAWLTVLSALAQGRFDPRRGRLADWLYIVARNRAVTYFRGRWRAQNGLVEVPLERLASPRSDDPARLLDRHCDVEMVHRALDVLQQRVSPITFAVCYLRQIEQRSVPEVAEALTLTHQQVRVYDHRARQKLELILLRYGFG